MTADWMNDASLAQIDKEKLLYLQNLLFESRNLSREQMLPFLMAVLKRGQTDRIQFTSEEKDAIIEVLKKNASPTELHSINKLLSLYQSRKPDIG